MKKKLDKQPAYTVLQEQISNYEQQIAHYEKQISTYQELTDSHNKMGQIQEELIARYQKIMKKLEQDYPEVWGQIKGIQDEPISRNMNLLQRQK